MTFVKVWSKLLVWLITRAFSVTQEAHAFDCVFVEQPNCIAFTAVIIHRELKADLLYDAPAVIPFRIQFDCLDERSHEFLLFEIRHLSIYLIKFQEELIDLFSGDLLPAEGGKLRPVLSIFQRRTSGLSAPEIKVTSITSF